MIIIGFIIEKSSCGRPQKEYTNTSFFYRYLSKKRQYERVKQVHIHFFHDSHHEYLSL